MKNPWYKVEVFPNTTNASNEHTDTFFKSESMSRVYADTMKQVGFIVFVLEEIEENIFKILEEV